MSAHTFPVAPVLRLARVHLGEKLGYLPADGELAEFLGVSIRTVLRWRHAPEAAMRADTADRLAEALRLHPTAIWPEVYAKIFIDHIDAERARVRDRKRRQRANPESYRRILANNKAHYQRHRGYYIAAETRRASAVDPGTGLTAGALRKRQARERLRAVSLPAEMMAATDKQEVA